MREIKLFDGGIVLVDDEDFEFLSTLRWARHKGSKTDYAMCSSCGPYYNMLMHRLIMARHGHVIDGLEVDHRNENGEAHVAYVAAAQELHGEFAHA